MKVSSCELTEHLLVMHCAVCVEPGKEIMRSCGLTGSSGASHHYHQSHV